MQTRVFCVYLEVFYWLPQESLTRTGQRRTGCTRPCSLVGTPGRRPSRPPLWFDPHSCVTWNLEDNPDAHLNLARAADGLVHRTQAGGNVVEAAEADIVTRCRRRRRTHHGELVVKLILGNVIDGNVEAGGIGDIEDLQSVLQRNAFRDLGVFHNREVETLLPGLAENVA